MSVDLADLRGDISLTLSGGVGVAEFNSTVAYENGQVVRKDPIAGYEAHTLVVGNKPRSVATNFRRASTFFSRADIETLGREE